MDFDKDEVNLDALYNKFRNLKRDMKWALEEYKLKEQYINKIQAELFFLQIDTYLTIQSRDELYDQLDKEFQELNF